MDFAKTKKIFSLFVAAFGLFVLIFIIYSIIVISRVAQKKDKQEIKTDYASEKITPGPSAFPTLSK